VNGVPATAEWLPVAHPNNPFPYEVLDCRCVALTYMSLTSDTTVLTSFVRSRASDGRELRGQSPIGAVAVPGELHFPGLRMPDGPLFVASEMEHKWDLYAYDGDLYARRSWTGDLIHTAAITTLPEEIVLDKIQSNTSDALAEIEFLVTWYVARRPFPFSIPPELFEIGDADTQKDTEIKDIKMLIAIWGWQAHGRLAQFGRRMRS